MLEAVAAGVPRAGITARHPLADAARAQLDLERRATTGSLLPVP